MIDKSNSVPTHVNKLQYYQQVIELMGFGTPGFQNTINNIRSVQLMFSHHFGDKTEVLWNPSNHTDEYMTIEASNRLFTPKHMLVYTSMGETNQVTFQNGVDPDGVLTRAMQENDLLHTAENEILYYENRIVDGINRSVIDT